MRLFNRFVVALLVLTVSIGVGVAPAWAAGVTTLQPLADIQSVEVNYVTTFNGEPGEVCKYEFAGANRYHGTCRDLVTASAPDLNIDLEAGRVTEFVSYDGKFYSRVNDEQTWTMSTNDNYDPDRTLNDTLFGGYAISNNAVTTNVGSTTVNGTAATQYQFWSTDATLNASSGGQYVYDVFVSGQGYVLKDQESLRGTLPMGTGELDNVWTYSNFNGTFSVSPPPDSSVKASSVPSVGGWGMTSLRGARW